MKLYLFKFVGMVLVTLALSLFAGPFEKGTAKPAYQSPSTQISLCEQYPESCAFSGKAFPKSFTTMRYAGGTILFLLGLYLLQRSYAANNEGIAVNPRWAAIGGDMASIFFLAFAAYTVWAVLFDKVWEVKSYLYESDELAMHFIALTYIPATVIMAFFTSRFAGESIMIDENGITIYYPEKRRYMVWEKIISLQIEETYTVAGGEDFAAPRQMQKRLQIKGEGGTMILYEPGLERIKNTIVKALKQFAPKSLQHDIVQIEQHW